MDSRSEVPAMEVEKIMKKTLAGLLVAASMILPASASLAATDDAATTAPKPLYTTADTPLGDLLDDPDAKAILAKYLPDLVSNPSIEMARGMTLKSLQNYAGDQVTDEKLSAIDADLAKLSS